MKPLLVPSLILLGTCLLGLGLAWNRIVPSSAYWSPQQAAEYTAAKLELHSKSHDHGSGVEQEMATAHERFAKISRELERARGSQRFTGTGFVILGVLLLAAGIAVHFAAKRSE